MLRMILVTGLLFLCLTPVNAQALENQPLSAQDPAPVETADGGWKKVSDAFDWVFGAPEPGLRLYKQNYGVFTWGSEAQQGSDSELKFQISARQHLIGPVYFGYTQKSFWRIWDGANSRPFRETNYNPEIFVRTRTFEPRPHLKLSFDLCPIEHESNGMTEPTSRSWNRGYIRPKADFGWLEMELKAWFRWSEDVKKFANDPAGDENPDIEDFYGNGELRLAFNLPLRMRLDLMGRRNFSTDKGAVEASLQVPVTKTGNIFFYLQFWDGYGESLIDYNHSFTSYGAGFSLRPGKKSLGEIILN